MSDKQYTLIYAHKNSSATLTISQSGKNAEEAGDLAEEALDDILKDPNAWRWQETELED